MLKFLYFLSILILSESIFPAAPIKERLDAYAIHQQMRDKSIFKNLKWVYCGPHHIAGRVTDIAVCQKNPECFYVATATGGLWVTHDQGVNWRSILNHESSIGIGDMAISQKNENLIWVGTGEANSSQSTYAGTGVFKSVNGGKTWQNMGLEDTSHIGRVIIDPLDDQIVYVAAMGHLYSSNQERGLYKTIDGGHNWEKILFISEHTGIIDLCMHPRDPCVLYAASWQRSRKAWNFIESGIESAIYKTRDGGKSWSKIIDGFPQNRHVGRIGLAITDSNPSVIYAILDNQEPRPDKSKSGITIEMIQEMTIQKFLKLDPKQLQLFLDEHRAPRVYSAKTVIEFVKSGLITPRSIARIFSDAQERRINPYVKGAEVYKSHDGGNTWSKVNQHYLENMYLTYGFYFGQIRVSPDDENEIYILGIPVLKSKDGGRTFVNLTNEKAALGEKIVHRDGHALWINPGDPSHLLLGTDGGINLSRNRGQTWDKIANLPISQCYTIQYDYREPFQIYCGLQDNGVVVGSSECLTGNRNADWKMIWGGDGAYVQIDRQNQNLVFLATQFGSLHRLDFQNKIRKNIQPKAPENKIPYRFNWLSPFLLSKHYSKTLYMGSNHVLRSDDWGENWKEISPDLSDQQEILGNVPYATITSLDESYFSAEVLIAGTDDGTVWLTRNGGHHWLKISQILPKKWISRVVASRHEKGKILVTMTGYRDNDFSTYVYSSSNQGADWESIKSNLPDEPVNVIREDPQDPMIFYLGTDLGVYISINGGEFWFSLKNNLPTVPVHDLKVHPRDRVLMIATHGRGVYLLSTEGIHRLKKGYQE
ncbi:MAG: glycosyl hydrolase [Candidatus Aminicenantes bacterium]|nr:glycosyl hydrolase [Candidatus Aminicenantes bacterium]